MPTDPKARARRRREPSPLCGRGDHEWCFNRSEAECLCGCACHKKTPEAGRARRVRRAAREVERVMEQAAIDCEGTECSPWEILHNDEIRRLWEAASVLARDGR